LPVQTFWIGVGVDYQMFHEANLWIRIKAQL
jgi:hypothetical protein